MGSEQVPFLDLAVQHSQMEEELVAVFREALRTGRFIGGPEVEGFEADFADFCRVRHSVGVGSGTDALRFALIASGIRRGDVVLTVPNTFIATSEAISQAGALPAFVDVDRDTFNIDPEKLYKLLTSYRMDEKTGRPVDPKSGRTVSAIVPVHVFGQMADMDPLLEIAEMFNLMVIEDACQAHGAEYFSKRRGAWIRAGSTGRASAFSFYPGKNLGAFGEGGAVTTNDDVVAERTRMLRDHGQVKKYVHLMEGYNGRLDAIQAGILRAKLKRLGQWNEERREKARRYNELFAGIEDVTVPFEPGWARHVYHLYVIRVRDRDGLQRYLSDKGINTGLHYPVPLHLQKAYAALGYAEGDFPVAEEASRQILSLPMYPGLRRSQQLRVAVRVKEFLSAAKSAGRTMAPERPRETHECSTQDT